MRPDRVIETCLCVTDLDAAEKFYSAVLGLDTFAKVPGRHVFFRLGQGMVLLFDAVQTAKPSYAGIPPHGTFGPGHAAFAVQESDLEGWRTRLREHGVAIESDYAWPGGGRSLYFRDPSGNSIELTTPQTWGMDS
jgi:catechol 2,3-dioxygenase-like lactoylglutathione lyase family enzyme